MHSGGGICPEPLGTSPDEDLAPSPTCLLLLGWFSGCHFLALSILDNETVSPQYSWGTQKPAPGHWGTQMMALLSSYSFWKLEPTPSPFKEQSRAVLPPDPWPGPHA